jgi:uncharacterized protein (DUF934 family)
MSEPKPLLSPLRPPATAPRVWTPNGFTDDVWHVIDDDAALPIEGRAIVSLKRWREEQMALAGSGVPIGILVQPSETLDFETDDVDRLALIALAFPKFTDGRAYSTARRLREHGYKGEIRATGDVLLDQVPLMLRCGFDSLQIVHAPTLAALERGELPAVSRTYQSGVRNAPDRFRHRRAEHGATELTDRLVRYAQTS